MVRRSTHARTQYALAVSFLENGEFTQSNSSCVAKLMINFTEEEVGTEGPRVGAVSKKGESSG